MKTLPLFLSLLAATASHGQTFLIGTGGGDAKGIYAADFDPETGKLSNSRLVAEIPGPGFLAFHPEKPIVYAAGADQVSGWRYADDASLELINKVPAGDRGPCHVEVHPSGKGLATANYSGGSLSTFLLEDDGSIAGPATVARNTGKSINPQRQQAPHAHGTHFRGDLLLVPDLGTDQILAFRFDPGKGAVTTKAEPAFTKTTGGDGPRHLAFHPTADFVFANHELSNHLEAYRLTGETLESTDRAPTLPDGFEGNNTTAEVAVHPNGRWIFVSNRGHDSIALFEFDAATGELEHKDIVSCGAETPRHFTLTPDGRWLLVGGQSSNDIHVMRFDPDSGELELTDESLPSPSPICLMFLPAD